MHSWLSEISVGEKIVSSPVVSKEDVVQSAFSRRLGGR